MAVITPDPAVVAQMVVTVYADGRPPSIKSNLDPLGTLRLIGLALESATQALEGALPKKAAADPVEKKRDFLGPRYSKTYHPDGQTDEKGETEHGG